MSSISDGLEKQKNDCAEIIAGNQAKLREYEKAYESLRVFKGIAERSQGDFASGVRQNKNALESISSITGNCLTAEKYYKDMSKMVSNIGSKILIVSFSGLISLCRAKLNYYLRRISECEQAINSAEKKLILVNEALESVEG